VPTLLQTLHFITQCLERRGIASKRKEKFWRWTDREISGDSLGCGQPNENYRLATMLEKQLS